MELRQLEYFLAVARERSISGGARRMHVVQSAMSAAIAKLERDLGAELFDRSTTPLTPTAAGLALIPEARATLDAARIARDAVARAQGRIAGTVTLGATQSTGPYDLAAALTDIASRYPEISIALRQSTTGSAGLIGRVVRGALDLALVSATTVAAPDAEVVILTALAEESLEFVCRADHPKASATALTAIDLAGNQWIGFPPGWGVRAIADAVLADRASDPHMEVTNYDLAADLIRSGLGVALLPASIVSRHSDLTAIPVRHPANRWQLCLATPARRQPQAVAAVMEILRAHADLPTER